MNLNRYSKILVGWSGGVDSLAVILHLLEIGVSPSRMELWHHNVDGRESAPLMDWPCTPAYCRAVADALGIAYYESWKVNGFQGEMLRENALTAPTRFEIPGGEVVEVGGVSGKENTRLLFPQVSPNLNVRWCSAYLKIGIMDAAIRNQDRFEYAATLVCTGERADESVARAKYKTFEPHRTDGRNGKKKRWVDHLRPIHHWTKAECWEIAARWRINPHPCYRLGFGRCSCMFCIFGNPSQWASAAALDPKRFADLVEYEELFGKTIKRHASLPSYIQGIAPYETMKKEDIAAALSIDWNEPIILDNWSLPAGATAATDGPQ